MNNLDLHLKRAKDVLKNKKVPDLYDLVSLTYLENVMSTDGLEKEEVCEFLIDNGIVEAEKTTP